MSTPGISQLLLEVFERLDYWDDGFVDGYVSHVGLRRIILETPELAEQIGNSFARLLLLRAENNLYGRLTLPELMIMAQEVNRGTLGRPAAKRGFGPRATVQSAAVSIALPNNQDREERLTYLDQYSCRPPPFFLLAISFAQIGVFVYHALILTNQGEDIGPNGPAYTKGPLIFNPLKKKEIWRFFTYQFVHSGYFHICFNILVQLMLGLPLEMVHRWWRILLIYLSGVVAGSLTVSITDPNSYLAGASGGVYALISAHLANVVANWAEMEFAALRLITFVTLAGVDIGVAVYYRYTEAENQVGLLLGIIVLRNLKELKWERSIFCCFIIKLMASTITIAMVIIFVIARS
jgi:rhomboid-related protein 1/2/3